MYNHHRFLDHSISSLPWVRDAKDFWVQVVLAIVTFFAVLVALFQEKIKDLFNKAILSPSIKLRPPDCHQIDLTNNLRQVVGKAIYIRICVSHEKGKSGENVEIILFRVLRKNKNDKWINVKEFLPMNLRWSHTHSQTVTIPPKSFRHCDLGSFRKSQTTTKFLIDTIVQPNAVSGGKIPNLLSPATYKFEILLTGKNVKPVIKSWIIIFKPTWSDKESTMLKKNIQIREIN